MLPLGVMVKWPSSVSLIPPMKTLVVKLVVKLFLFCSTPNHAWPCPVYRTFPFESTAVAVPVTVAVS
jgi:hypothetical protein